MSEKAMKKKYKIIQYSQELKKREVSIFKCPLCGKKGIKIDNTSKL